MSALAIDRSVAVLESLAVHAVFAVIMVFGLSISSTRSVPRIPLTIQATVVDRQAILDHREQKQEAETQVLREAAAERRRQQEAERQRRLDQQRQEQAREAATQRRRDEDVARRRAADEEKQRLDELDRKRQELQQQREKAAEQTRREEERLKQLAQVQAQEDQARRAAIDEERRRQLMDMEQTGAEMATLEQEWIALVQSIVTASWQRPPTAREGLKCLVQVHQAPGGRVLDVSILPGCNGDEATRRSIVNAVWRSDPLPYRGYEQVLKRNFKFEFVY